MPRKRLYKNNAEKMRQYRLRRKLKEKQYLDSLYEKYRQELGEPVTNSASIIENSSINVQSTSNTFKEELWNTEADFIEFMIDKCSDDFWKCSLCSKLIPIYYAVCPICKKEYRPEYLEKQALEFMEIYPHCRSYLEEQ